MPKGHGGQTCAEAIGASFAPGEVVSWSELSRRVKKLGSWVDETIWQNQMSLIVNLPPAHHHWANSRPFLFLRGDGQYEIYDERKHPKAIEGSSSQPNHVPQRAGSVGG